MVDIVGAEIAGKALIVRTSAKKNKKAHRGS